MIKFVDDLTASETIAKLHPSNIQHAVAEEAKVLGLTVTSNLKWNSHVNNVVSKSSKRIYLLVQLKRAKVPIHDVL